MTGLPAVLLLLAIGVVILLALCWRADRFGNPNPSE